MALSAPSIPDDVVLTCVVGEDHIIYLKMGGRITKEYLSQFRDWGNEVRGAMVEASQMDPAKVRTLIDVSTLLRADIVTVKALYALMQFNKDYATKTAVYGASPLISSITHSAIVLTHRYSMRLFRTREEAMDWLSARE